MAEAEERNRLVAVARSFLGTPYHHMGRKKGIGIDCLTLLAEVFHEAGLIPRAVIPYYPNDWHLHREAERYLEGLLKYTREIEGPPKPGDIALWKFGRCFSHGALVIQWPVVIHAYIGRPCAMENAETALWLSHIGENSGDQGKERPKKFFSFWEK